MAERGSLGSSRRPPGPHDACVAEAGSGRERPRRLELGQRPGIVAESCTKPAEAPAQAGIVCLDPREAQGGAQLPEPRPWPAAVSTRARSRPSPGRDGPDPAPGSPRATWISAENQRSPDRSTWPGPPRAASARPRGGRPQLYPGRERQEVRHHVFRPVARHSSMPRRISSPPAAPLAGLGHPSRAGSTRPPATTGTRRRRLSAPAPRTAPRRRPGPWDLAEHAAEEERQRQAVLVREPPRLADRPPRWRPAPAAGTRAAAACAPGSRGRPRAGRRRRRRPATCARPGRSRLQRPLEVGPRSREVAGRQRADARGPVREERQAAVVVGLGEAQQALGHRPGLRQLGSVEVVELQPVQDREQLARRELLAQLDRAPVGLAGGRGGEAVRRDVAAAERERARAPAAGAPLRGRSWSRARAAPNWARASASAERARARRPARSW